MLNLAYKWLMCLCINNTWGYNYVQFTHSLIPCNHFALLDLWLLGIYQIILYHHSGIFVLSLCLWIWTVSYRDKDGRFWSSSEETEEINQRFFHRTVQRSANHLEVHLFKEVGFPVQQVPLNYRTAVSVKIFTLKVLQKQPGLAARTHLLQMHLPAMVMTLWCQRKMILLTNLQHISGEKNCFKYSPSMKGLDCVTCALFVPEAIPNNRKKITNLGNLVNKPLSSYSHL